MSPAYDPTRERGIQQRSVLYPRMTPEFRAGQIVDVNGEQMRVESVTWREPDEQDLALWPDMPLGSHVIDVTFRPIPLTAGQGR